MCVCVCGGAGGGGGGGGSGNVNHFFVLFSSIVPFGAGIAQWLEASDS